MLSVAMPWLCLRMWLESRVSLRGSMDMKLFDRFTSYYDCITSYLTGSEKSGAWEQFTFEGDVGYLDGRKISKVVTRGTKRYLLIRVRLHYLIDDLMQIADRRGIESVVLLDERLLDDTEGWDELFFEWYAGHIRAAASTDIDSDVQFDYRVVLADRTRHHAKSYATVMGLDWDSVAHRFTPDYVLKDDPDLLTRFALRDMGVEDAFDSL